MALVVGTDAYISQADADAYWSARSNVTWSAATNDAKDAAIRQATQYLDGAYSWIGDHPGSASQLLGWPRNNAVMTSGNRKGVQITGIPQAVKDACAELALLALSSPLKPSEERGGQIKRTKVDVIEVEYSDTAPSGRTYPFISMLLKGLHQSSGISVKLVRA